jgi:signal transduction histidine kinase
VAGAALWIVAALLAGGVLLSALFRDSVERGFDARLEVLLNSLIAAADAAPDGTLALSRPPQEPRFETPYSGWYWQIAGAGPAAPALRSRSVWDLELGFAPGPGGAGIRRYEIDSPRARRLRVLARDIELDGVAAPLVFSIAADRAEVETDVAAFNAALAWSLGGLGLGLVLAVLIQVRYGLRPLRRIRGALAEIRAGRAERLEGEFPAEVTPLADELNGLLDHTAEVLDRARTHVGNLAHALKTPLTVLGNEADATGGALAETVRRQTAVMRRQVDHHLSRARAAGQARVLGARTELKPVLEALARTLEKIYAERGIRVTLDGGAGLSFRGERHDLEEMLGNLVDNACKWGRTQVRIRVQPAAMAGSSGMRVGIVVDDDGPGVPAAERAALFHRGKRLDEAVPGSGLGLAIVRDIAGLYGGEVTLADSPLGGLRVTLTLPGMASRNPADGAAA